VSALGGVFLFTSAAFFVLVVLGTWLAGKKQEPEPILWAEPLHPVPPQRTWLDRYGMWTIIAVVVILLAWGYPVLQHLQMTTYGSPGFKPF
jgi:cytochrome c oxidase subunit 1